MLSRPGEAPEGGLCECWKWQGHHARAASSGPSPPHLAHAALTVLPPVVTTSTAPQAADTSIKSKQQVLTQYANLLLTAVM